MLQRCQKCAHFEVVKEILSAKFEDKEEEVMFKQWVTTDRTELTTQYLPVSESCYRRFHTISCWPIVLNPTVSSQIGYLCRNWNATLLVLCIVEFIFKMAKRRADVALKRETLENYLAPPKLIQRAAAEQLNVILKNWTNNSRWIWKTKSIN